MNTKMEPKSEEKEKIYTKKKINRQTIKDSNTTLDLISDDLPMIQNFGYCLTTANDHSIIHDIITDNILGSNFVNDSIDFDNTNITQRKELSQKIIEIIKDTIKSKISNKIIFPFYHFKRGFRIVYYNQLKKINDFQIEFHPFYSKHLLIGMLSKDKLKFKIINPFKIAQLMELFDYTKHPKILNKQVTFSKDAFHRPSKSPPNKSKSMKPQTSDLNPTITLELMTKIPIRNSEKMKNNKLLEITYGKAKEATVGIRRFEYAYNMKTGFKYNKNLFKQKIKTIQRWWRSIIRCHGEFYITTKIQSRYRGHLSRIAMYDTCRLIDDVLPFLYRVDNIMVRNKIEYFFNILYRKYAYLSISKKLDDQIDLIKRNIKSYIMRKRQLKEFSKPFIIKCLMIKFVCETTAKDKIDKLQSTFRYFLMNNNDKIMHAFGHNVHPYLYYKLKYKRKTPLIYKKKIVKFNQYVNKFKLLNLKANKGITNKFDYLRIILLRRPFNELKLYHKQYIHRRKTGLLSQFINDLHNKTKLQKKYFDRWRNKTSIMVKQDQCMRLDKIVKEILVPQCFIHLGKYFSIWKTKITLIYKIVSLFHKKKTSDNHLFLHKNTTKYLKDLFHDYNTMRPGQREKELLNAIQRWKGKVNRLKMRDEKLNKTVLQRDDNNNKHLKMITLLKLRMKCNAVTREERLQSLISNKSLKEHNELENYFQKWKKDFRNKVLTSILNQTLLKTNTIKDNKLLQWKNKAKALNEREKCLGKTLNGINNHKLLEMALNKYRKKTQQVKNIESSLRSLVKKTSNKNDDSLQMKYFAHWKFKTLMANIMIKFQTKKMKSLLSKWRRCKQSIHFLNTFIQKKNRIEISNLKKYFDKWRNYNVIYKKLIIPLYQTKLKLFEMIISKPFNKRNYVNSKEALEKLSEKANGNKANIVSNLKNVILKKHSINLNDQFNKWKAIKDNIVSNEELNQQRYASLKNLFNDHSLRYSNYNLQKYFTQWRKNVGYHLRNCFIQKETKDKTQLKMYFLHWKKQAYRYRLHKASSKLINRVKRRNYLREFNEGCNEIFIKRLIQAATLYKKRSQIKKTNFKNLFSFVKSKLSFTNGIKGLINIAPIANRQFRLYFLKWKIQMRRIIITQRRFYKNVQRRLLTNEKKSLLTNLVKRAGKRSQQMTGGFFKNYRKAAGVYYVKCSHVNLQVFFLYRQKKYLSKRKYRMLKYVINKVNTKLIKHQSLKRFTKDWIRIIRFCSMTDCLRKRITSLDKGKVTLRFGIRKWFYMS